MEKRSCSLADGPNCFQVSNFKEIEDNDIKEYRSSKMIKKNFIKFKAKSNSISIGELNKNQQKNFLRKNTFNMKNTFNEVKGILN